MEKAREKYDSYYNPWKKEFFDERTGGYVVVHIEREKHSLLSKNERTIYEKEIEMVKVFARNGHQIEMLKEVSRISSPDVNIDGIPADLKRTKSVVNVIKYAKKAVNKQGARMVLFQFDKMTPAIKAALKNLSKAGIHGKYFITKKEKVYDF